MSSKSTKNDRKFNVYVVEDHNDALGPIYKHIGQRKLNFDQLVMVHFDSHPDLGIPDTFPADSVFDKASLFENLSIENWILPAVYAGHLSVIVWIKPRWSNQINVGKYELFVGKDSDGFLKCNSKENYFVNANFYTNELELTNKRPFTLYVIDFQSTINGPASDLDLILNDLASSDLKRLIFDIDLDFFSTQDPFRCMFDDSADYELFKDVYKSELPFDKQDPLFDAKLAEYLTDRKVHMEKLSHIIGDLINGPGESESVDTNVQKLANSIRRNKIDFEILHSYGTGLDECSLPHYVSTDDELTIAVRDFNSFIEKYFIDKNLTPSIVTIARSSLDDYCPPNQVNSIQKYIIDSINDKFNNDVTSIQYLY